jgi:hypothetical protein
MHKHASALAISIKEDKPFVHAHAVLGDQNGNAEAGHLLEGEGFCCRNSLSGAVGRKKLSGKMML